MNLADIPLFKAGILGKVRTMVSSPTRAGDTIRLTEVDTMELKPLPTKLGWADDDDFEWAFRINHALKIRLMPDDKLVQIYSERSYYPLDPFKRFDGELESMTEIAKMSHARALERVFREKTNKTRATVMQRCLMFCFILDILAILYAFATGGIG